MHSRRSRRSKQSRPSKRKSPRKSTRSRRSKRSSKTIRSTKPKRSTRSRRKKSYYKASERHCKKLLSNKISQTMNEYKNGRFKSRQQAIAVAYSILRKSRPGCRKFFDKK